jgi:adenine/guanine phosphoribosyltransferase-like PRPP-binding protein
LWRHLAGHEQCLAQAAGVEAFTLVTTVPSGARERDGAHPLHAIAGELVGPLRDRYVRALARSAVSAPAHEFHTGRFECRAEVSGHAVLLVDDMWTTGANAQSAAAALKAAGAIRVAAVVIGRHLNRDWRHNDRTLRRLPQPFDWSRCGLCAPGEGCRSPPPGAEHSPPVLPGDLHELV